MAYAALTDARAPNRDYVLVGPELISHDEAAALFTEILGREVRHVRISEEQLVGNYMKYGVPEAYARRISGGEVRASRGEFAILDDTVAKVLGREPISLRKYVEKNKRVWEWEK